MSPRKLFHDLNNCSTLTIPIVDDLKRYLEIYKRPKHEYLFPARQNNKTVGHIKTTSARAINRFAGNEGTTFKK